MTKTRFVTGHDQAGSAILVRRDTLPDEEFLHSPGFSAALIWRTEPGATLAGPEEEGAKPLASVVPAPGGTSAMLVTFPPDHLMQSVDFDPEAAAEEMCARLPGLGDLFEADAPGFHRTDTIDYGVVLDGEVLLELDDGRTNLLRQGDIVIQMGTRHAWRNPGNTPARLLFVLVGAQRVSSTT